MTEPYLRMLRVDRIRVALEERTTQAPLLVIVDDVHRADQATIIALRTLPQQLAARPVIWLMARCVVKGNKDAERLFDLLMSDGATRLRLEPLTDCAMAEIATDTLGAPPDPGLRALTARAGGNPFLLVELLKGLTEEGAVCISQGGARLVSTRLPQRIRTLARYRLGELSPKTRQLVESTAILGWPFSPDDAAAMLGETPAALLPLVEEALAAGVFVVTQQELAFRHDLIRQAVAETVPHSLRQAVHRHIGEILLNRGGATMLAATHLVKGAQPGDARALDALDRAVAELTPSSPGIAAYVARCALELTDASDTNWAARVLSVVEALSATGQQEDAVEVAQSALARPGDLLEGVRIRCAMSRILLNAGRGAEAAAAAEMVLATPSLPDRLHDEAELALLNAQVAIGEVGSVCRLVRMILSHRATYNDRLVSGASTVLAMIKWDEGKLTEGLNLIRRAVQVTSAEPTVGTPQPRLVQAMMLIDICRANEVNGLLPEMRHDSKALGPLMGVIGPKLIRARLHLIAGRSEAAVAEAKTALALANKAGAQSLISLARSILGAAALRTGDLRAATKCVNSDLTLPGLASLYEQRRFDLVSAQITEACHGASAVRPAIRALCDDLSQHSRVLLAEPTAAAWLVRTARATGDLQVAGAVAAAADRLATANPEIPSVHIARIHARALVDRDPRALAHAAAGHTDQWACASAAEDLGVLLGEDASLRRQATARLDEALAGYEKAEAKRDAARVRRRLRRLGERRRHWVSAKRPGTGWVSLTETQRTISKLVAQGLTNQEVAGEMYVSVHTVAFHLRQVFRKLGIHSRVELARLEVENGGPSRPAEP